MELHLLRLKAPRLKLWPMFPELVPHGSYSQWVQLGAGGHFLQGPLCPGRCGKAKGQVLQMRTQRVGWLKMACLSLGSESAAEGSSSYKRPSSTRKKIVGGGTRDAELPEFSLEGYWCKPNLRCSMMGLEDVARGSRSQAFQGTCTRWNFQASQLEGDSRVPTGS